MKGVQIVEPNKLQIVDLEKPQIDKENNVLVRMVAAGICGSDVGIYHGTNAAATYPRIIGHENVGIVEEIGEGVTRVKVGDRVIIDQVTACGHCYACRKGRPNVCGNLKVRGVHIDGGYREYMAVPDRDCYLVPEILSDEEAVMIEPTTIAVQCCSRAELESEDTVMIIGSGALGSSILRIVKLYNPKAIIVTDIDDAKLEEAKKNGATYTINSLKEDVPAKAHELTEGYGPTVTIDAACVKGSLLTALQATGNARPASSPWASPWLPPRSTSSSSLPRSWTFAAAACRTASSRMSSIWSTRARWICAAASPTLGTSRMHR